MPPKQKEVKKGPAYKASIPLKDIVPLDVKEPPREPKQLKIPQAFPEPSKNSETLPLLFEQWPSQQSLKTHDFGISSQAKFLDSYHENITAYMAKQRKVDWKHILEIKHENEWSQQQQEEEQVEFNHSKNQIESFKSIPQEKKDGPTCVIQTFMRPENQHEMQARLKQEAEKAEKAAKDKKKAAKKEQPKQQGPIQVSDVKMSDILTKRTMPQSSIWIGSQLQIVKQRNLVDVNNNQPIWKKIYPQENGVPQITKSGKYWVKLLHMGKYVKIEVDDRIAVDEQGREMFPISAKHNQKWTLIITKALIKYLSKVSNSSTIGSGLVAYALTGMVSQNISLSHFKQWQKLQQLISNQHYQRKDMIVSCFSLNSNKSFQQTTRVKLEKEELKQEGFEEDQFVEKEVDTKIINGFAYCIGDYFDNDSFNMVFSQEKTQKEMLLKHEYNELCKISISNKSREEKLQYRKKKKELKEKLAIEEKKRLELISKPPIRYHFLKLLANLKVGCEYGQKQILLAKKCVLNKLNQPPNYDIPLEKDEKEKETKSIQSLSVSVIKYKQENELFPNLHDFSSIPGVVELLQRKDRGKWINDEDFLTFFEAIQILYNPNAFATKKIETVESKRESNFTYDQNKQILVVEKVEQDEEKEKKIRLLFGYTYQKSSKDIFKPYTLLQKFDFDSFRSTSTVVTLNSDLSSKLIELKNQNTVFKLYTMSRGNYNYWISCDSPFKLISISDYLTDYEGYTKKNITFQYPPIEAKTYFPLARLKLKQEGADGNTLLVKLVNVKDELLGSLNYRLFSIGKEETALTEQKIEGIITKNSQSILLAYQYTRFQVTAGLEYYLIVEAQSEDNIADGTLELQILSKEEGLTIEQTQQVQPVKFIEKYVPNKYGIICKERIFTNTDNNATITVKLAEFEEQQGSGGGKAAKKGGKEQPSTQLLQKPFQGERSIILKIMNGDSVLYEAEGVNEITVPNFKFQSTKTNSSKEYYLQVKFNLRIWPQAAFKNQSTDKICWVAQVIAQDSLALVRDTKQEDKEKQTRKSWEDSEPGRAERAKKARRKFLIELKKERGQALTEEEEQILNAPRLTKKQMLEEERKNEENKKGKGGKKDDKKGGKDAKKEEVTEQKQPERDPPKSQNNFMNEIQQFLKILQNCVVKYEPLNEGQSRIRSEQELKAIRQATKLSGEDRVGKLIRNIQKRQTMKIREKEKKESISIFFSEVRGQFKQKYNSYIEWRNQDVQKDRTRQDKERLLIDIINQEKPTISEPQLKKTIHEYREINAHNPYLADVADMVRKNIKIANLNDKISSLLVGWEVEELKVINEEIKNDKIQGIDHQIHRQFKEMLEEAEKNPNIVAEKQAQAKKAKKGGKK